MAWDIPVTHTDDQNAAYIKTSFNKADCNLANKTLVYMHTPAVYLVGYIYHVNLHLCGCGIVVLCKYLHFQVIFFTTVAVLKSVCIKKITSLVHNTRRILIFYLDYLTKKYIKILVPNNSQRHAWS